MMRTGICELFDIKYPIFAFSHSREVVAAVTQAGGLGVLGAAAHSPERLDSDLAWIGGQVGSLPFGVDLIVPAKYAGKDDGGLSIQALTDMIPPGHRAYLDQLLARYEVPPLADTDNQADTRPLDSWTEDEAPMTYEQAVPLMDVAFSHPISLIVNALGPPPPDMVERAHSNGVKVGALAGKKSHAVRHVAGGVDVIIAQGYEAGGHTGEIGTMVLVPEIVDAVAPLPVLAAGGIGNGRQLAASLALGAEGVWCGSVWLTTEEAETLPVVKEKFLDATSSDTLRSRSRTGKPARQLRSAWTDEWEGPDSPGPLGMPLQPILTAEASKRIDQASTDPDNQGAIKLANYFVGQIVGSLDQLTTVDRVVVEMVDEFVEAAARLNDLSADSSL